MDDTVLPQHHIVIDVVGSWYKLEAGFKNINECYEVYLSEVTGHG